MIRVRGEKNPTVHVDVKNATLPSSASPRNFNGFPLIATIPLEDDSIEGVSERYESFPRGFPSPSPLAAVFTPSSRYLSLRTVATACRHGQTHLALMGLPRPKTAAVTACRLRAPNVAGSRRWSEARSGVDKITRITRRTERAPGAGPAVRGTK